MVNEYAYTLQMVQKKQCEMNFMHPSINMVSDEFLPEVPTVCAKLWFVHAQFTLNNPNMMDSHSAPTG